MYTSTSNSSLDPITHGIAGALLGKGYFSKRQSRVTIFAATLGAVFPDIDIIYETLSRDPLAIVKYHRAITHSFVGLPFFAALLAWLTRRIARRYKIESPSWALLTFIYGVGIASHILLDGMTSFGARMWYPLSSRRVAWDLLFIIDFTFSAVILVPQVIAWIYARGDSGGTGISDGLRGRSRGRATRMWILFTIAAVIVWFVGEISEYRFHFAVVPIVSAILAILFFGPAARGWGFRVSRAAWCQAGTYAMILYLTACGVAHHQAMQRVETFAASSHINVERIGALPVPPSLLVWGDMIRSKDGVYQSRYDLRDAEPPAFTFVPDSPHDQFLARAFQLPEVQLEWQFARYPTIRESVEGDRHIVDFAEHRFSGGPTRGPQPFSYRVDLDGDRRECARHRDESEMEWTCQATFACRSVRTRKLHDENFRLQRYSRRPPLFEASLDRASRYLHLRRRSGNVQPRTRKVRRNPRPAEGTSLDAAGKSRVTYANARILRAFWLRRFSPAASHDRIIERRNRMGRARLQQYYPVPYSRRIFRGGNRRGADRFRKQKTSLSRSALSTAWNKAG